MNLMSMKMKMEDSANLLSLLQSDRRPIEEVLAEFNSKFPRSQYLTICSSLSLLLQSQELMILKVTERLIAFAIIYQCYSQKPSANPFLSEMINTACNEKVEKCERAFLLNLLQWKSYNNGLEIFKQSAVDYTKSFDPSTHDFPELGELQREYADKANPGPSSHTFAIFADPEVPRGCDPNLPEKVNYETGSGDRDEALSGILESLTVGGVGKITPQWIRPVPPRYPVHQSEMHWIEPGRHAHVWDEEMCSGLSIVRDLLRKGLKETLSPTEQKEITRELENDPKLVDRCGITPLELPKLVEHNTQTAAEILTKLINSDVIVEHFAALGNMGMNLHSMEVVNRLTTAVKLPEDFIRLYITLCISSCETPENKEDKYLQNRLVRLLCAFSYSLICNKIIDEKKDDEVFEQVEAFCKKFSRIREAASLLRLLETKIATKQAPV